MILILRKKLIILCGVILAFTVFSLSFFTGSDVPIFSVSNGKIIVLDPGHGAPDGGAVGYAGTVESGLNLAVAKKLKSQLEKRGYTIIMTRTDENGLQTNKSESIREKKREDMNERLRIINNSEADLFVSIHMNLFRDKKYRGAEVIYADKFENSLLLAELIQAELKAIDPENQTRQVKKHDGSIFLLKNAEIPAVLVECGFISNPEEEKLLKDKDYQYRVACAICDGITEYYKSIEGRPDIM